MTPLLLIITFLLIQLWIVILKLSALKNIEFKKKMKVLKLPVILCTISWSGLFSVLYFGNFATQIFVCENSVWPRLSNGKLCYGFVGGKETPLTRGLKLESVWITAVMIDSWRSVFAVMIDSWRYLFVVIFFFRN